MKLSMQNEITLLILEISLTTIYQIHIEKTCFIKFFQFICISEKFIKKDKEERHRELRNAPKLSKQEQGE